MAETDDGAGRAFFDLGFRDIALSPTHRLLCLAAAPPLSRSPAALRRLAAEEIDRRSLVSGAVTHRIAGPVMRGLRAAEIQNFSDDFRRALFNNAEAALKQCAELARLTRMFATANIRVIVLKGVALSLQLYGDVAMRGVGDIDLLVDGADLPAADALLTEDGYRRETPRPTGGGWRVYRDIDYVHPQRGSRIELHQRLTSNPQRLPLDFERLWRDRQEVSIAAAKIAVLPDRVQPLYLCVHGAAHGWSRLCWIADLAVLLAAPSARAAALSDAAGFGLDKALRRALALADILLGAPEGAPPPAPAEAAWARRSIERFFIQTDWRPHPRRGTWTWLRFEFRRRLEVYTMKDGRRHIVEELTADLTNPIDRTVIRLPERLHWLYPLLRPIGWLIRNRRRGP